jgi:hypothetical protein
MHEWPGLRPDRLCRWLDEPKKEPRRTDPEDATSDVKDPQNDL